MKKIKILLFLFIVFLSAKCFAGVCLFTVRSSVNFGSYNPFASTNNDSMGNVRLLCVGAPPPSTGYTLTLSGGNSGRYLSRYLINGSERLNYNLYKDAARTQIWGDSGGAAVVINKNGDSTIPVYGRIPVGQDVGVGNYTDTIVVTINF